jgi:CheY-like chemotaxis protein/anti-sigma regulatory factor (Ser/Thr protein kinase)
VLSIDPAIPPVRLDMTRVRQVIFNLLSNASKFTENGTITLKAYSTAAQFVIIITDTGIGMTDAQKSRLFQDFSQADNSTTRKYGGTGLGLAISKRFCEMMQGGIEVESAPDKGTSFIVTLPARLENERASGHSSSAPPRVGATASKQDKSAILIIDDDAAVRELLHRNLAKEGYTLIGASDGDTGLQYARAIHPRAIILDVLMPHKDGWSVLKEIKSDPTIADIPVIMYTMVDERRLGLAIGAAEYLLKPVEKDKILQVLERLDKYRPNDSILVVDDDADILNIAARTIEKEGWRVTTARNGAEALAVLAQGIPRLVFLDLMMPEMDGFEFLNLMQSRREWSGIPVVIVTAKDLTPEERQRLVGSVERIVEKGHFTPENLLKQLTQLLPNVSHMIH